MTGLQSIAYKSVIMLYYHQISDSIFLSTCFLSYYNEEAVSLDQYAALLINKRRSDRQGSETVTGVMKAR